MMEPHSVECVERFDAQYAMILVQVYDAPSIETVGRRP